MPQFLRPKQSTQHRVAAIALYRALLSRCSSAPLPDDDRVSLCNAVRNKFRRNRNLQSPYLLGLNFRAGYATLDHLDASLAGNTASVSILTQLASRLSRSLTRTPRPRILPRPPIPSEERLACLPPERAVLNVRPYARTSGPRRVPILASANGTPFLRLTKPQPPSLTRILRQHRATKTSVFHMKVMLANWLLPFARHEDAWDALVNMRAGGCVDGEDDGVKWVDAVISSEKDNQKAYEKVMADDKETTRKMQKIIDLETKLALEEGQTIIRGRKKRPIRVIKPSKP